MHRLFVDPSQFDGEIVRITGAEHIHLVRVLRVRAGEPVCILDGQGNGYHARVIVVDKRDCVARIESVADLPADPAVYITVAQALGKGDKFEQVVQHGTEAGASAFVPLRADRCVAELPEARTVERVARWKAIAKGAAEQSCRAKVPAVLNPAPFRSVVAEARDADVPCLMLHTGLPAVPLRSAVAPIKTLPERLLLLVGPEGGWSEAELELAASAGCDFISLGPYILRTETAALVAISQLLYQFS